MTGASDINKHINPEAVCCPVCDSGSITQILEISQVPVYCNRLWESREQALASSRGNIRLCFCKSCNHIFNADFDPALLTYNTTYENSLHFSPKFQEYADNLAHRLVQTYSLYDKDIIEIGCGNGDFLKMLCDIGKNRGYGFDPSYSEERYGKRKNTGITFINDADSTQYSSYRSDLLCCRHVLEHIMHPQAFIQSIQDSIRGQNKTVVFFEVPNVMYTLKDSGIWDLIYEHCGYFTHTSLGHLFTSSGFHINALNDAFDGQFLHIEASQENNSADLRPVKDDTNKDNEYIINLVETFIDTYNTITSSWRSELDAIRSLKQKAVVWGGGSKGVSFLNTLNVEDEIKYVVDINPHKLHKYVAGTGHEIVSPEFLREYQPDVIYVMNPVYFNEIGRITESMHLKARLKQVV